MDLIMDRKMMGESCDVRLSLSLCLSVSLSVSLCLSLSLSKIIFIFDILNT